jgi:aspartyl-tRNA synthetase
MFDYRRTHTCGELRKDDCDSSVTLVGWVHRWRDHGGLIFIDLRDRFGLTQLVFDPAINNNNHAIAETLRAEWVIGIKGKVISRHEGMANANLASGDIEIEVHDVEVLSQAKTPPFSICEEDINVNEELRLKYRYLDIRRGGIMNNLLIRHRAMMSTRRVLDTLGFLEVSTPILGKSTPEGARDYLVPSRINPGTFYALPQSPQLFKQLLMVSGVDKYFQMAQCFRDEDLRSSRQPEFTQIDIEMSFSYREDLFAVVEHITKEVFKDTIGVEIPTPFRHLSYADAMDKYGTDKPDLRFKMKLVNISDIAARSSFQVFKDQVDSGGIVKGLCVKGGAEISRKGIDEYTKFVGRFGVRGLAWMKMTEKGLTSNIVKFFDETLQEELADAMDAEVGDIIFLVAEQRDVTNQALDHLRRRIAADRGLIDPNDYAFAWVTDFPLFEWDEEEQRLVSMHHPFTSPHHDDLELMETEPAKVRSSGYDLTLNGHEVAGGSQRIHDGKLQEKIFALMNLSKEEVAEKFGFFVEALQYGTPPHLGIAFGFDRLVMVLAGTENIRDVIAFPKTQKASDLMMDAPSAVHRKQLDELEISVAIKKM